MFLLLEKLVFFGLIFSLPFQKRFFLFGTDPLQGAEFNEWASGFFYFTDFLVFFLFLFWLKGTIRTVGWGRQVPVRLGASLFLLLLLGFAFISLARAELIDVGIYRFLKLAEFVFLFFYVAYRARAIGIRPIAAAFVASGVFQSALAILQFAKQSSLGLEIFHESTLEIGLKGVAQISVQGIDMIRAYGTFPSPNVLAGFLGLCLLFLFYLYTSEKFSRVFLTAPLFLLTFGLALTFSRGVITFFFVTTILFFAGVFLLDKLRQYRKQAGRLAILVIVSWLLVVVATWPEISSRFLESSVREPAIQERLFFNKVGLDSVSQNYSQLFFGVGIGNFVHHYTQSLPGLPPHLYQPVHNIFLLIASEIGIFGLVAFVIFLTVLIKKPLHFLWAIQYSHDRGNIVAIYSLLLVACFLVLVAMYDHYFWTLQQGGLMFWVALGLLAGRAGNYNKIS